jgi:hypothetical protein
MDPNTNLDFLTAETNKTTDERTAINASHGGSPVQAETQIIHSPELDVDDTPSHLFHADESTEQIHENELEISPSLSETTSLSEKKSASPR